MKRSSFTGSYTAISTITGATQSSAIGDNAFEDNIPIGFTFTYLSANHTTIGVNTNGIAAFSGINGNADNMSLYSSSVPNSVLAPWWDDLNVVNGTGSILYQLQGIPGNRTFTIQWTDVNSFAAGSTSLLNFQVILFEQSNKIEFRYGVLNNGIFNTANESASIGLKSAIGGNAEFIDAVTGSSYIGNGMLCAKTMWPSQFFRFLPGVSTPLNQPVYTVGQAGDYTSLSEAIADLNHRGVSSPVIFALIDSLFDDSPLHGDNFFPLLIGPVAGTSIANTVHIQAPPYIQPVINSAGAGAGCCATQNSISGISATNEPVLALCGAKFISINGLALHGTTAAVDRGLLVINFSSTQGTRNCGIRNIIISLDRSNTSSVALEQRTAAPPFSYTGSNSDNVYENIYISDSYAGAQFIGDPTFPDSTITFWNSNIGRPVADDIGNGPVASFGIHIQNVSCFSLSGNQVRHISVNGNVPVNGIWIENALGNSNIYNNQVYSIKNNSATSLSTVAGINVSVSSAGNNQVRIFNNFIYGISSGFSGPSSASVQVKGIFVQPQGGGDLSDTIHVDFNNIGINANGNVSSVCVETATLNGPVIDILNNILYNSTSGQSSPASHFCFNVPGANQFGNSGSVSDHNDIFITDNNRGFTGKGNSTNYVSLADWQSAMSSDALTLNTDPQFVSVSDLHILNTELDAGGLNLSWAPMDYDNQVRYAIPDIGADEIFPPDGAVDSLISPVSGDCYTSAEPIVARIENAGNSLLDFTIDTLIVSVQVTGAVTQNYSVVLNNNSLNGGSPLSPGAFLDIYMGTINMTANGTYYFTATTFISQDGNPTNDTFQLTIQHLIPQVVITGASWICASSATMLTANASGGDGNYSYQWSYGLGTAQSVIVSPSHDSLFYVSITDGCGVFANDSFLVHILPVPTAQFTWSQVNNTVTFTDASQNATGWSWSFGDSQSSTQQNPSHTYTANGTYTVVMIAANSCGIDTAATIISIITTGMETTSINGFDFYPNPAGDNVTLTLPAGEKIVIELTDMNGKVLLRKDCGNTKGGTNSVVDLSGYESGIYFLRVSNDKLLTMKKLVIEK